MDRIGQARSFLDDHGREIDRARFAFHFGSGTRAKFLEALARYQNPDGGFGNGLEPDIGASQSNPFATELALLFCLQAGVKGEGPLVNGVNLRL